MTHSEIKAILKKEKAYSSSIFSELMSLHPDEIVVKPYSFEYKVPKFHKFDY